MIAAAARKLVFRIGDIGFVLDLDHVIEILEDVSVELDLSCNDISHGIVGALNFRQTRIPAVDPNQRLVIESEVALPDKSALVLSSSEGNWALLVDRVDGVSSTPDLKPCDIPPLIKVAVNRFYSQIELLADEPLIVFEPTTYYGAEPVSA